MINTRKGYNLFKKHNITYLNFCKECDKFELFIMQ